MIFHDVLENYRGQKINVILDGATGMISGELVFVGNDWVILSNTYTRKQYVDINKIASFWCDDDKVEP